MAQLDYSNRAYKDSLFTFLFSDPKNLISLYNALYDRHCPPDTKVEINTLEGILFKGQQNDISFIIEDKYVVLIEHQSTINTNMPLRLLSYVAKLYERMVPGKDIYRERMIKIPTPEFVVLYNGSKDFPEQKTYKLSDAFITKPESPHLELIVKVYNVNNGQNKEIMRHCDTLDGYSIFVDRVKQFRRKGSSLKESIRSAISFCLDHNVLKDFLSKYESEVASLLYKEFNLEDAISIKSEESFQEGKLEGKLEGERIGLEKGKLVGMQEGERVGLEKGKLEGERVGLEKGKRAGIQESLKKIRENMKRQGFSDEQINLACGCAF